MKTTISGGMKCSGFVVLPPMSCSYFHCKITESLRDKQPKFALSAWGGGAGFWILDIVRASVRNYLPICAQMSVNAQAGTSMRIGSERTC